MDRTPVTSLPRRDASATRVFDRTQPEQRVLRNTYLLLSATLLFSAAVAGLSMAYALPGPGILLTIVGYYGLLFAVEKFRNSAWGVGLVFALTGFMGYTLGPILSHYLRTIPNGGSVVMTAFGITGAAFLALSAYAVVSRRRFTFMTGFLVVGSITAFLLGLVAIFFHMPGLSLAVSGLFVLLSSGIILWQTGEIVNGGETNYITATVTLYVSIYNMFLSLLQLLGFSSRN
jgi:modulator of FtsH protease